MTKLMAAILMAMAGLAAAELPLVADLADLSARQTGRVEVELTDIEHRFAPPPAPGEHPRVLISPAELPALRARLRETAAGRRIYAAVSGWHRHAFGNPERLGLVWEALVDGDLGALEKAGSDWWLGQLELGLSLAAADALISENAELGAQVGAALTTLCEIRDIPDHRGNPKPHSGVVMNVALAYDYAFNYMSEDQRAAVRGWIARGTAGRQSHGMSMAPERRTYNWMPHGLMLVVAALAIEGEEGYDPDIYPKSVEVMRDFLTYGICPAGVPREGMHYHNFGLGTGGAKAMIAFAKRGDSLFGHPHYVASRDWYAHAMEPFGYTFATYGDTVNDRGGIYEAYVLMKWVWPEDPMVDFVWRNRAQDNYGGLGERHGYHVALLYATDWDGGADTEQLPVNIDQWGADAGERLPATVLRPWDPTRMGLPNTLYSPTRGSLFTRTHWEREAMSFNFHAKMNTTGPSHSHADRNDFTFSALGRKWAIDHGFHIKESKHHNIVLIDGLGQGAFTPPGRIAALLDLPFATAINGDASYAYHWRYTFSSRRNNPENRGYEWEVEPLGPPTDELHTLRAVHNPVAHAWRSGILVRGAHPYIMILDDIRKDDEHRLYEWLMQVPNDLRLETATSTQAVLAPEGAAADDPRLLVRLVDHAPPPVTLSDIPQAPRLEQYLIRRSANTTGGQRDHRLAKRLVLSTMAVEPQFKVLLFPHRPDAPLPETVWDEARETLTVRWEDQEDVWRFTPEAGLLMQRAGGGLLALKTAGAALDELAIEVAGAPVNLGFEAGRLYVSGRGWQRLELRGLGEVEAVHHDGSVTAAVRAGDAIIITE